jgi:hypothetical protein
MQEIHFEELSPRRRQLFRQMHHISFGRYERLGVESGDPVIRADTRIIREIKFGKTACAPPAFDNSSVLKEQQVKLLNYLDQIGNGTLEILRFQCGLPFQLHVEDHMFAPK